MSDHANCHGFNSPRAIQRVYNEVVAPYYDLDPQGVYRGSVDRVVGQLRRHRLLGPAASRLKVLDLGIGTGLFLARLKALVGEQAQPFGLDLAEKMVERARRKIPDLTVEVGDAANLSTHFPGLTFDLICTHFLSGYVPLSLLAPAIRGRLAPGGHWSFIGGTKAGFPALRARADSRALRWLCGAGPQRLDDVVINPADLDEVARTVEANGFEVCAAESFEPNLLFRNMDAFMEFAYRGGWLTPILEAAGLHKAGAIMRLFLNWFYFPIKDHHSIVILLARQGTA